jgi:uncharacterized protein YecT (DUF1311 family)
LKRAEAELDKTYRPILSKYQNDPARAGQIKKAQTAWLAFRAAEIEALMPKSSRLERGSSYPMCRAMHLARLTAERIKALQRNLLSHAEGDVCTPGSS